MRYLNSVSCAQMFTAGQMIRELHTHICLLSRRFNSDEYNWPFYPLFYSPSLRSPPVCDIISPRYLKTIMPLFDSFWSIGAILLAAITYFVHTWKEIYLSITLPTILYIISWYFLADSPQWHIRKGNIAQATRIILEAAETNEKSAIINGDFIKGLAPNRFAPKKTDHSDSGLLSLWKCNRNFVNIVCIHLIWGAVLTNFNGMLLNTRNFGVDTLNRNVALTGGCFPLNFGKLWLLLICHVFVIKGVSELIGVLFAYTFVIHNSRKWLWSGLLNIIVGVAVLFVFLVSSARKSYCCRLCA